MSEANLNMNEQVNITDDLFEKLPEDEKNAEFIAITLKTFFCKRQ